MPRIIDGRVRTEHLVDGILSADATGRAKMADSFVNTSKLGDDAVTQAIIADSAVGTAQIIGGEVTNPKLDSLFQTDRLVAVGTVEAWVDFPTVYGDTPVVTTAPGPDVAYARITNVLPGSFSWQADAPGSASWLAHGHRS